MQVHSQRHRTAGFGARELAKEVKLLVANDGLDDAALLESVLQVLVEKALDLVYSDAL